MGNISVSTNQLQDKTVTLKTKYLADTAKEMPKSKSSIVKFLPDFG